MTIIRLRSEERMINKSDSVITYLLLTQIKQ